jgi:hypothetical protein
MKHRYLSILFLLIFSAVVIQISYAQTVSPNDSNALGAEFHRELRIAVDSAIMIQQKIVDSLSRALETSLYTHTVSLKTLADSLLGSARELLDSSRIDSALQLHKEFSGRLKTHGQAQRQALRNQLMEYEKSIIDLKNTHEACIDCAESDDFKNKLSAFYDNADSSSDVFFSSISDYFDDASSSLSDSSGTLSDSLITFVETLIDNRASELDSIEEHSNKLMISMDANSYAFFHGRDGGINQAIVSPLISFRHSSGIKLSLGTSWMEQRPPSHWDGTSLGFSYEFMFSPVFGGSIGYTHFWFDSSSTQIRSVFNQSVDGELDLSTSAADFSLAAGINFDDQSEYYFEFTATHYWQIGRKVILAPMVIASWGEQNLAFIAKRLQKVQQLNPKTKKVAAKKVATSTTNQSNIFSILDYEIVVPLSIRINRIVLTPSVTAVFPLAVFDGSRNLPFLNAELTATIDWIW